MPSPNEPPHNQRQTPRRKARPSTRFTCHRGSPGAGVNLGVALLDVSETGVRLLVSEELEPDQEIEVRFLSLKHFRPIKLAAQVIWAVPTADRAWCVGASFQQRLSPTDLRHLAVLITPP
jgi:hypothetical protein